MGWDDGGAIGKLLFYKMLGAGSEGRLGGSSLNKWQDDREN